MDERDEMTPCPITITTTVVAVTAGKPNKLTTVKYAVNPQGIARHIMQQVAVRDDKLFEQLRDEVVKGDEIRVTLVTTWGSTDCRMTLLDFSKLPADAPNLLPAKELAAQAA